jgi:hypothetical protein
VVDTALVVEVGVMVVEVGAMVVVESVDSNVALDVLDTSEAVEHPVTTATKTKVNTVNRRRIRTSQSLPASPPLMRFY